MAGPAPPTASHARGAHRAREPAAHRGHPRSAGALSAGVDQLGVLTAAVEQLADRLALTRLLDQPVQLLSGGERQRAALARALIGSAPLLLLDEPTSQQDESSVDRVVRVLGEEVAAGRSVLTASHDPRVVSAATIVLELDQGRIRVGPRLTADAGS